MERAEALPRAAARQARWRRLLVAWAVVVVAFGVLPTHAALQAVAGERESASASIGHLLEFALFAYLAATWLLLRTERRTGSLPGGWAMVRGAALALLMTAALGGAIELVQGPLPYRDLQLSDLVMDMAGGLAGVAAFSCVGARRAWAGRRRAG